MGGVLGGVSGGVSNSHAERVSVHLLVVGQGPVAERLIAMAGVLGWRATSAVTMSEVTAALPRADAVVVTSHHEDLDAPAAAAALGQGTAYVGAMGSRPTQERRRAWLRDQGVGEEALAGVRGPAGLDIGAGGPGEIALSILAEALAVLRGRPTPGSISERDGPIHPGVAPGAAYCPEG